MPFEVTLQPEAVASLGALDPEIRRRIRKKLTWLAEHSDELRHASLSENLAGLCKLRVGSYRVVYELVVEKRRLVVHAIGHRSEIYDRR